MSDATVEKAVYSATFGELKDIFTLNELPNPVTSSKPDYRRNTGKAINSAERSDKKCSKLIDACIDLCSSNPYPCILFSLRNNTSLLDSSQYHERCAQPAKNALPPGATKPTMTTAELKKADIVTQDKIWRQAVDSEQVGAKKWENTWGFLTEYDDKGSPVKKEELPTTYERFPTGPIPSTNSSQYGARLNTELGQRMLSLEFQLSKSNKRQKLDSEMVCY